MYRKATEGWVKHLDFTLLELICLFISLFISACIRHGNFGIKGFWDMYDILILIMIAVNFAMSIILHSYSSILRRGAWRELKATLMLIFFTWGTTLVLLYMAHMGNTYSRKVIGIAALIQLVISYSTRLIWKTIVKKINMRVDDNKILIIAHKDEVHEILRQLKKDAFNYDRIVGIATFENSNIEEEIEGVKIIATAPNVVEYVQRNWVDEVIIAVRPGAKHPLDIFEALIDMGVTVHVRIDTLHTGSAAVQQVVSKKGHMLLLTNSRKFMSRGQAIIKRTMDIIGGLAGCVVLGILYIWVAPKIKKESPGPVFFKQTRIGRNGRTFQIYKFRSMYLDAEERKKELMEKNNIKDGLMFKMDFDPRVIGNYVDEEGNEHTGIGDLIRRKSIDEFPQFINVLKGDMSLVGTRPPTPDEYEKYELHHKSRLAFPVGVTGMWQVSGRSEITDFEEVVRLDNEYIQNWSIGLDIKILFKTVAVVLMGKGAK